MQKNRCGDYLNLEKKKKKIFYFYFIVVCLFVFKKIERGRKIEKETILFYDSICVDIFI